MNTPNKLTLLRIILVPVFMAFMMYDFVPYSRLIGAIVFVIAFITDWLDGFLARKYNLVTNFGKIMDPLADKMLTTAALVCLNVSGEVSAWVTMIILTREFIVSGIRIAAAAEGNVIAASWWGKAKTMWQSIALTAALVLGGGEIFAINLCLDIAIWIAAILTVISGVDYIVKNGRYVSMK